VTGTPPKFVANTRQSTLPTTEARGPPLHLSAVLRSWEDKFGARLLQIWGFWWD
jgi:hypothetical protein